VVERELRKYRQQIEEEAERQEEEEDGKKNAKSANQATSTTPATGGEQLGSDHQSSGLPKMSLFKRQMLERAQGQTN